MDDLYFFILTKKQTPFYNSIVDIQRRIIVLISHLKKNEMAQGRVPSPNHKFMIQIIFSQICIDKIVLFGEIGIFPQKTQVKLGWGKFSEKGVGLNNRIFRSQEHY